MIKKTKKIKLMILSALVISLLLVGTALAQGSIDWWVIGSGGGSELAGSISLDGTVGQAVVGTDSNSGLDLCAGFWCGAGAGGYKIHLPVVLRNYS